MAIAPTNRMEPPPRSLAFDAHLHHGFDLLVDRIQVCDEIVAGRAPLGIETVNIELRQDRQ